MPKVLNITRRRMLYLLGVLAAAGLSGSLYYTLVGGNVGPWTIQFLNPSDGQRFSERDDKSGDACVDGFTHDVVIRTNAPDGTVARLLVGGLNAGTATVSGGAAAWTSVAFPSKGDALLVASVGAASTASAVRIHCAGAPRCDLIGPTWDSRHPVRNGVHSSVLEIGADAGADAAYTFAGVCPWGRPPDAGTYCQRPEPAGGDHEGSRGGGHRMTVDVSTTLDPGGRIDVWIDGTKRASAFKQRSGVNVRLTGLSVGPEDQEQTSHTLRIECVPATGLHGFSAADIVETDTEAPQMVLLAPWQTGRLTLTGGQLQVCASTTSPDALDLGTANLCASVGTSTPTCAAMTTGGLASYCASVDAGAPMACPDGSIGSGVDPLNGCYTCWGPVQDAPSLPCWDGAPADSSYYLDSGCHYCLTSDGGSSYTPYGFSCPGSSRTAIGNCPLNGCPPSDAGILCEGGSAHCQCGPDAGTPFACPDSAIDTGVDPASGCFACWCYQLNDAGAPRTDAALVPSQYGNCPGSSCANTRQTSDGACILLDPPGTAAFDLVVTLADRAGNITTERRNVVGTGPVDGGYGVVITEPPYGLGNDPNTHLLADDQPTLRKDEQPDAAGCQYTVRACTNAPSDAGAALYAGIGDAALTQVGGAVALITDGGCKAELPYEAVFTGATLPESLEFSTGALWKPTRIRVQVAGVLSPPVDTWIDTIIPQALPVHACDAGAGCPNVVTMRVTDPAGNVEVWTSGATCPLDIKTSVFPVRATVDTSQGSYEEVVLGPPYL